MDDGMAIIATSMKIEHFSGWKLKSPLGILENKFTNQGYKIWKCENFKKKLMHNLQKLTIIQYMNWIKVLCGVDDENGPEEIYLYFDKDVSKTLLSPPWPIVYVSHNFYKPAYKHLKGCIGYYFKQ
jgi:hypothetical protein